MKSLPMSEDPSICAGSPDCRVYGYICGPPDSSSSCARPFVDPHLLSLSAPRNMGILIADRSRDIH